MTGRFINNIILLATRSIIEENYEKLKKSHQLYIKLAKKHISKFDLSKYQLVHLSYKQNININWKLVLDGNYIIIA